MKLHENQTTTILGGVFCRSKRGTKAFSYMPSAI